MTATGKTDRRQLREMGELLTLEQLTELQPYRRTFWVLVTEMERRLQILWASVLGTEVSGIGADDTFLRIGGDSIGVLRMVREASNQGLSLPAADLFCTPRLCELARVMTVKDYSQETIAPITFLIPNINEGNTRIKVATLCGLASPYVEDVFPCKPLQEGLLAMTAKRSGDYVSQRVLELQDHVDIHRFQKAWAKVILITPILRTQIFDLPEHGLVQVVIDENQSGRLTKTFTPT